MHSKNLEQMLIKQSLRKLQNYDDLNDNNNNNNDIDVDDSNSSYEDSDEDQKTHQRIDTVVRREEWNKLTPQQKQRIQQQYIMQQQQQMMKQNQQPQRQYPPQTYIQQQNSFGFGQNQMSPSFFGSPQSQIPQMHQYPSQKLPQIQRTESNISTASLTMGGYGNDGNFTPMSTNDAFFRQSSNHGQQTPPLNSQGSFKQNVFNPYSTPKGINNQEFWRQGSNNRAFGFQETPSTTQLFNPNQTPHGYPTTTPPSMLPQNSITMQQSYPSQDAISSPNNFTMPTPTSQFNIPPPPPKTSKTNNNNNNNNNNDNNKYIDNDIKEEYAYEGDTRKDIEGEQ